MGQNGGRGREDLTADAADPPCPIRQFYGNRGKRPGHLRLDKPSGSSPQCDQSPVLTALAGEARILAGEMPTEEQLQALGVSEPEARGWLAVQAMGDADGELSTDSIKNGSDVKTVKFSELTESEK